MTNATLERSGPCRGFRVLDLSSMVSGPMAGQILADLGADVIKVEPLGGDVLRYVSRPFKGLSSYFHHFNRGKRSIAVDLKSPDGVHVVHRIASKCDVLIENFRPSVAERLGLGYENLKNKNPGLIYVSINGFGSKGPYSDRPAYDHVVQALVGFMARQGWNGPPIPIRAPVVDKVAAMSAAMSSLAALLARQGNGGAGQRINVKMFDAWAAFILHEQFVNATFLDRDAPKTPVVDIYRVFETSDGHVLGLVMQDDQFRGICDALGLEHLTKDARFADPGARITNVGELNELLAPRIAAMKTEEFLAAMEQHEVPFAPANDFTAFLEDPQAKSNHTYFEIQDPQHGTIRSLNFFATFDGTPLDLNGRGPRLGEHTLEVLRQFDWPENDIDALTASGAIGL